MCNKYKKFDGLKKAQQLASKKGGSFLSKTFITAQTKYVWKCNRGHVWKALFSNVIYNNTWCPKCSSENKRIDGLNIATQIAKERDGACLSKKYINARTKMIWKCNKCNSVWNATIHDIKDSFTWCPLCNIREGKNQKILTNILNKLFPNFNIKFNFRGFDWLKTMGGHKQELDIYVPLLKLAIEYDGEQHFRPIQVFGGQKEFEETLRRDALKNMKVAEHPEDVATFIRIPYTEPITEENIIRILRENMVVI